MRYLPLEDAVRLCGLRPEVVDELLDSGIFHARTTLESQVVISASEADELRVARTLLDELGVNLPGVEIILRLRRTQLELRRELDRIMQSFKDELRRELHERDIVGPAGYLPPPERF
ncbi:hypothetical protein HY251_14340 [bacterium]|nr:hypothetical protein [bacterium]